MKIHKGVKYTFISLAVLFLGVYLIVIRYEKEILRYINQELSHIVRGEVQVKTVHFTFFRNFPAATFTLREVQIKDTLYHQELFRAEKVFLQVDMKRLLRDGLVVHSVFLENASLVLFRDSKGYFNLAEFRSGKEHQDRKNSKTMSWMVQDVGLRNAKFSYNDTINKKSFQFQFLESNFHVSQQDTVLQMHLAGSMHMEGLAFNTDNGSFLADKNAFVNFRMDYIPGSNRLVVHPSQLQAEEQRLQLKGFVQLAEPSSLEMVIENPWADYRQVAAMLTPKIEKVLKRFTIEGPLNVKATLSGPFKGLTPHVYIRFKSKKTQITAFGQQMKDVALSGFYNNQIDTTLAPHDTNSLVQVTRMYGKYYGLPVNLAFKAIDLSDPVVDMQAWMDVSFKESALWLHPVKYQLSAGQIKMNLDYVVKVREFSNPRNSSLTGKLNGNINIRNGECRLLTRGTTFGKINSDIRFNNSDARITDLKFNINGSPIEAKGELKNLIPFLLMPKQKIQADLQVFSSSLDLGPVIQYNPVAHSKPNHKPSQVPYVFDDMISKIETTTQIHVQELKMQNFVAHQVKGTIKAVGNSLEMKNIKMLTSGGSIGMDGKITMLRDSTHRFELAAAVKNVDVSNFFFSCSNFNQKIIEHHNLKGTLTSSFDFKGEFNQAFKVNPHSMEGNFQVKLRNGGLYHFESLQQISRIIFKKRDFMNIRFATIDNIFSLRGREIDFQRTEIASSVLSFFFE